MKRSISKGDEQSTLPLFVVVDGSEGRLMPGYGNGNRWYARWSLTRPTGSGGFTFERTPSGAGYTGSHLMNARQSPQYLWGAPSSRGDGWDVRAPGGTPLGWGYPLVGGREKMMGDGGYGDYRYGEPDWTSRSW